MKRKVALLTGPGRLEISEQEIPKLQPNEILIQVISVGLCHSDVPQFLGLNAKGVDQFGNRTMLSDLEYPMVIGHEPIGIVVDVGKNVKSLKPGDLCSGPINGAFASHLIGNENNLFLIPETIRNRYQCLVEPLMCVVNVLRAGECRFMDYFGVVGCGFMGLLTISGFSHMGAREVIAIDILDERLELAKKYGATKCINPAKESLKERIFEITKNKGVDVVAEFSGSLSGLETALSIAKNAEYFGYQGRGRILMSSLYAKEQKWNPQMGYDMMFKSPKMLSVHPWYSEDIHLDAEIGIEAYQKRILPVDELITHTFSESEIQKGFEMMAAGDKSMIKGIVKFDHLR